MRALLHICCGPCSIYPSLKLKGLKIDFDAYFYNPNIKDFFELLKRYKNAKKVSKRYHFSIIKNLEQNKELEESIKENTSSRCNYCYIKRFDKVFEYAKKHSYDYVLTTLLGSPYQSRDLLLKNLDIASKKYNIPYKDLNFKEGFYYGQKLARENDIYCQKYCGCIISYENYLKNIKEELLND